MSLSRCPDGRWLVDIEPVKNRRFRKKLATRAEALRFMATCRKKMVDAPEWKPRGKDNRRLVELVQLWYDFHGYELRDGERRKRALEVMAARLGNPVAAKLDPVEYVAYRRNRGQQGISGKTLNNELLYLRAVYNELFTLRQIEYPCPVASVRLLRLQQQELSWLTIAEVNELLSAIRNRQNWSANPHLELIVMVCLATGARWSEAEHLNKNSVRHNSVTFSNTKNGKVRTVPIREELEARLLDHWSLYGPFTSSIGAFRRALEKTTIQLPKGQASHVLRHTFASHFMMNGGNILTLQKILGHSSVTVTMRYAHLAPDHLKDAITYGPKFALFG